MRWEDERFVKVYTRDTADWLALSFDAQALFLMLLRKVDRAGILPLGKHGKRSAAVILGQAHLWSRLEPALDELLSDGCVAISGDNLVVPNFLEAQEAVQSDAARQRAKRERDRDGARSLGDHPNSAAPADLETKTGALPITHAVTKRDSSSQNVTESHALSRAVTPRLDETRRDESTYSPEPAKPASVPTVMEFPVVGQDDPAWGAPSALLAELRAAFPDLDVLSEFRKAHAWLTANKGRRKTPRGMPRFLFGWCERAQNRGGQAVQQRQQSFKAPMRVV